MSHRTTPRPTSTERVPAPATPPTEPLRILVVDDDHRVRDSLADLIGLADGVHVVGTTSQPAETLDAIDRLDPGVVVIDPYLPDLEAGLALIGALHASGRRVLRIVATCRDDGLGPLALAAGADACVDRCADPVAFQEAVLAAARPGSVPAGHDGHAGQPAHPGHPGDPARSGDQAAGRSAGESR